MSLIREIQQELKDVVFGSVSIADGVIPPVAFVVTNAVWGVVPASLVGVGSALAITVWRLRRGRPIRFALAGLFGTTMAATFALVSRSAGGFFLPGIITGAGTTILILISIAVRRPFVAWTSVVARGWPLAWYWHPLVRPAYSRTSWLWAAFFATRTFIQWRLYSDEETAALATARVIMGWPALLVLLIATYVLGRRWLGALHGPSVEEFEAGKKPPWQGQQRGF
ncbi:MAG: DUF3159 domain-containing protein [Acidimicrobiia bacterium]|nr:DUF3159 domain-containing protein [Acidimicrobiia bacterium]